MIWDLGRTFAVYSVTSGEIRILVGGRPDRAAAQIRVGESATPVSSYVRTNTHRIDPTTGFAELLPPAGLPQEEILEEARAHRDRLLADSDWTQAPDNRLSPEQRGAWAAVREQWRARIDDLKSGAPPRPWADAPTFN